MVAVLVAAAILEWGLAALLVAVSGFVIDGVNGTGPEMPAALLLTTFVIGTAAAPIAAWIMRARRIVPHLCVAVALAPLAIAGVVLLGEPFFRPA